MKTKTISLVAGLLLAAGSQCVMAQSSADVRAMFSRQVGSLVSDAGRSATGDGALNAVDSLTRLFGGDSLRDRLLLKREGDRYFAGLSGSGGEWFGSLGDAQGFLFRSAIAASSQAPAEVKQALTTNQGTDLSSLANTATQAVVDTRILIGKGGIATVTVKPKGLAATGVPAVAGPPGTRIDEVRRNGGELSVRIATAQRATSGPALLSVFNPGSAFIAADRIPVFVVAGDGEPAAPIRKAGATADAAFSIDVGDRIDDSLPAGAGTNFYRLLLASAAPVTFSTSGASDTVVSVQDEAGRQLGADDDSGERYNAKLTVALAPGAYIVKVAHCCEGAGLYQLAVTAGQ